jgi:DNA-binding transcriptional LysR family regulator
MKIPYDLLRTFIVFAEAGNVVETAKVLGISQPAVSNQLAKLEEILPLGPFASQGGRKTLSSYGKLLYVSFHSKLKELDELYHNVNRQFFESRNITLRIGGRREIISRYAHLLDFGGRLDFEFMASRDGTDALLTNQVDMAILSMAPNATELTSCKLFSVGAKFCYSRQKCASQEELKKKSHSVDFLMTEKGLSYREDLLFLSQWCRQHAVVPALLKISRICEDWTAIVNMVASGMGYAIIPQDIPIPESVISYDIPNDVISPSEFYLVYQTVLGEIAPIKEFIDKTVKIFAEKNPGA